MQKITYIILFILFSIGQTTAQKLKPYTVGGDISGSISEVTTKVKSLLNENNIEVIGEYSPANDLNNRVLAITSSGLKSAVKMIGGKAAFGAALRVGITQMDGYVTVSYTTPEYWANAYFRDQFPEVEDKLTAFSNNLKSTFANFGENNGETFGSEKGIDAKKLRNYKYMIGMPKFNKTHTIGEFDSYKEAISTIDENFKKGIENLEKVYSIEFEDMKLKLYGVGLSGKDGESYFLPKIDNGEEKHTAFLPYEMLVWEDKVYMLHGRFRIALSFPDLSMGTFMKIMSTPGNIKDLLQTSTAH